MNFSMLFRSHRQLSCYTYMASLQAVRSHRHWSCYTYMASLQAVRYNSNRAAITRLNNKYYVRLYPTVLVQPDGSTVSIRHTVPRRIIKLPLDLSLLSEAERKARLRKREPKEKILVKDDIDDDFDSSHYRKLTKKRL